MSLGYVYLARQHIVKYEAVNVHAVVCLCERCYLTEEIMFVSCVKDFLHY